MTTKLQKKILECYQENGYETIPYCQTITEFDNFCVTYQGNNNKKTFTKGKVYYVILLESTEANVQKLGVIDDKGKTVTEYALLFELFEDYDISKFEVCVTCGCLKYFKIISKNECSMCKEKKQLGS